MLSYLRLAVDHAVEVLLRAVGDHQGVLLAELALMAALIVDQADIVPLDATKYMVHHVIELIHVRLHIPGPYRPPPCVSINIEMSPGSLINLLRL